MTSDELYIYESCFCSCVGTVPLTDAKFKVCALKLYSCAITVLNYSCSCLINLIISHIPEIYNSSVVQNISAFTFLNLHYIWIYIYIIWYIYIYIYIYNVCIWNPDEVSCIWFYPGHSTRSINTMRFQVQVLIHQHQKKLKTIYTRIFTHEVN